MHNKLFQNSFTKHFLRNVSFYFFLFYIADINVFVIRTTFEIVLLEITALGLIYNRRNKLSVLADWFPFLALLAFYEMLRGLIPVISPFMHYTLYFVYDIEAQFFGSITIKILDYHLTDSTLLFSMSVFGYSLFFIYPILSGFYIWFKHHEKFSDFKYRFFLLTYISLVIFFVVPTAPPWLISNQRQLGVERILFKEEYFQKVMRVSVMDYLVRKNEVAALPSLHVAWMFFTSFFFIKNLSKKYYFSLIFPILTAISVIITGEHFVLDVLLGLVLAFIVFLIPTININLVHAINNIKNRKVGA